MTKPQAVPVRYPCHCLRCGHEWQARKPRPSCCNACNSVVWDIAPTGSEAKRSEAQAVRRVNERLERIVAETEVERLNPARLRRGYLKPGEQLFVRERVGL